MACVGEKEVKQVHTVSDICQAKEKFNIKQPFTVFNVPIFERKTFIEYN